MAYTKTTFVNGQAPALSAEELNKMGQGIEDATNEIVFKKSDYPYYPVNIKTHTNFPLTNLVIVDDNTLHAIRYDSNREIYRFNSDDFKVLGSGGNYCSALGYNPVDKYIWSFRRYNSTNYVYRFNSSTMQIVGSESNYLFDPNNKVVVGDPSGGGRFWFIDKDTKQLETWIHPNTNVTSQLGLLSFLTEIPIDLTYDGNYFYVLVPNNKIYKFDISRTLLGTYTLSPIFTGAVNGIAFHNGKLFVVSFLGDVSYYWEVADF